MNIRRWLQITSIIGDSLDQLDVYRTRVTSDELSSSAGVEKGTRASQGWGWAPQGWGTKVGFSGVGHKSGASQGWDEKGAVRVATKTKGFARAQRRARVRLARRSAE